MHVCAHMHVISMWVSMQWAITCAMGKCGSLPNLVDALIVMHTDFILH